MWVLLLPGAINPHNAVTIVLFTIAAKRYKLRERERHVNIQAIVEEHYERYLDQEEEYMREAANKDDVTVVCIKDVAP